MVRRRTAVLVLGVALGLAAPAAASRQDNQPSPQVAAAMKACQDKGLKQGTDEFKQCVQQQLGGTQVPSSVIDACKAKGLSQGTDAFAKCVGASFNPSPPSGAGGKAPPPAQQAAVAACKAKGLVENSNDFMQCIKEQTATGPALTPQQQAATDACKAKGIPQLTDAFKQCANQAASALANASLTPKQLAAFDACKANGLTMGNGAFKRCLDQQLTTVIKTARPEAEAEMNAAIAACNAKNLKVDLLRACLKAKLGA